MPEERRREKIEQLLREVISTIVDRDVEFPAGTMVTVTRVSLSADGQYANAYVSILGTDPKSTLDILKKTIYAIQAVVNKRLWMRPVPRLSFKLDEEEFRREQVERRIAGLKEHGEL